jgi:hypothetical protein
MNLKKKIFPLAVSVLMGVGSIGVANAASPFDFSRDVISETQQQSNLGTKFQSSAEKPVPEVTIAKTQTNVAEKTKSTVLQKPITGKNQSPKFQDRTNSNTPRYQCVDYNNCINYSNCYQNYKQQTGSP